MIGVQVQVQVHTIVACLHCGREKIDWEGPACHFGRPNERNSKREVNDSRTVFISRQGTRASKLAVGVGRGGAPVVRDGEICGVSRYTQLASPLAPSPTSVGISSSSLS